MIDRRDFVKAAAATSLLSIAPAVHAGGNETLKLGLVGCGGRGNGAAHNAVNSAKGITLHAIGDVFPDKVEAAREQHKRDLGANFQVTPERCFSGWDAYKKVIDSGVDVVLLATPPNFRPAHFKYAVDAGKHCFVEKPVGVDGPGVRSVMDTVNRAKEKNLAVVSGLCWRYHNAMREMFARIHEGQIGNIISMEANYNTGLLWSVKRKPDMSDMEFQLRNWLYYTWLSGDHIVEQFIHTLDKAGWAMKDQYPMDAVGLGGRQQRTDPQFGNIFDHHAVVYSYPNDVKVYAFARQQKGTYNENSFSVMGTKGIAHWKGGTWRITGENPWRASGASVKDDMYVHEHTELYESIRSGKPINNGEYMCKSTLLAILGRMATYTGQKVTWEKAWNSTEDLSPAKYEFGNVPMPAVPIPGVKS